MAFTSLYFLIFVAAVTGCYYAVPQKSRWIVLLAASYVFYLISSPKTFIFILFTTVVTFFGGRYIGRLNTEHKEYLEAHKSELSRDDKKELKAAVKKRKRKMVFLVLLADFGVLAALKYFRYYIEILAQAYGGVQLDLGVLIPLGISFYTFQSAAYIIDLYRSKIEADSSLPRFALFLSFFPQIVQGPIARYDQLAGQLYEGHRFSYTDFTHGMQLILWGFFKKLVIADRVAVLVSQVFDNYGDYHGAIVFIALLGYSVQIYADFSGGIDIARGVAGMMGIEMSHNFMRPYFSDSISEFWRRWHMSLSFWCRDYIFYPISLSKFFGKCRQEPEKCFRRSHRQAVPGAGRADGDVHHYRDMARSRVQIHSVRPLQRRDHNPRTAARASAEKARADLAYKCAEQGLEGVLCAQDIFPDRRRKDVPQSRVVRCGDVDVCVDIQLRRQ